MKKRMIIAALSTAAVAYVVDLLVFAGEFRSIEPHFAGNCRHVPNVPGPEDIAIVADGSAAYLSSHDRLAQLDGRPTRGRIFYYDLSVTDAVSLDITPSAPKVLHPHGIGLYQEATDTTLFVVNHPRGDVHGDIPGDGPAHAIEVFAAAGTELVHRETIVDENLLITPNDIAPVGQDTFYVTNDHGSGDKTVRMIEDYLRLGRSHVLFYDGSQFRRLDGTYGYANGIAASQDLKRIYMASPTDRSIFVFDRDPRTNMLNEISQIDVRSGVDNISVDADGDLWIGAHPKLLTMSLFLKRKIDHSPSQVLRVRVDDDGTADYDEILLSDGSDLSASTVAARYGDRLLVGGVFSNGFLDCRINDPL